MAKIWHNILIALIQPWQHLPLGFHYAWGKCLSGLMRLFRYRRDVVITNLSRSFPNARYQEIRSIAKDFYKNIGQIAAETMWLGGRKRKKEKVYKTGMITLQGQSALYEAFANGSIMILNSHAGNWELIGAYMQMACDTEGANFNENDVAVVYRRLHGSFSETFFHRNRCALQQEGFEGYVESRVVMRYVVRNRNRKKIYVFPNDQYPYGTAIARGTVDFLNQKTKTMTGGAEVAVHYRMAVIYMNANRTSKGHYTVTFTKICDNAADMGRDAIIEQYYRLLEQDIQKNKSNYLWSHKRWK